MRATDGVMGHGSLTGRAFCRALRAWRLCAVQRK